MIVTVQKVYRCEHCSGAKRKKSFRKHIVARHEAICFANPNRTPMPGEVTQSWQTGRWEYDEDGGSFVPYPTMPPWWPGVGMVYTGSKWLPVDGYKAATDEWPTFEGKPLYEIKPWARRLYLLDVAREDMPDHVWDLIEAHRPIEDYE